MGLRHLHYLIAVVKELHSGHAAEHLGISQPPLSQQVQALEEEIDARLFGRTNRRVELTDVDRLFPSEPRQVLAQVDKVVLLARRAHLGKLGELKIGFTPSTPFIPTIPSSIHTFRKAYPGIHLGLQEMNSRRVLNALLEESPQVGVIRPLVLPGAVHWVELFREPLVAVLWADHPLAAGSEDGSTVVTLAEEPSVLLPRSYDTGLYDQVIALTWQTGSSPRIAQEVSEAMIIIGLVSVGPGASILSASLRRTRVDGVIYRILGDPEATVAVWLVRQQNESPSLALPFIDLVTREAVGLCRR